MKASQKEYLSIFDFISTLKDSSIEYAILRNYENLLEESLYVDGHGDIDLICSNSKQLAQYLNARPHEGHIQNGVHDEVHYYIHINHDYVSLDLRFVGDGYYCEKWQKEMLERRTMQNGFYVLDDIDYFYSLIYHAIFQKKNLTDEYKNRLKKMAENVGILVREPSTQFFVGLLEDFMVKNDYQYVYPLDKHVPLKTKHIQKIRLLKINKALRYKHLVYDTKIRTIEILVQLKQKFLK